MLLLSLLLLLLLLVECLSCDLFLFCSFCCCCLAALLDDGDLDSEGSKKRLNASRQLHLRHLLFAFVPVLLLLLLFILEPAVELPLPALAAKDFDLRRQQAFGSLLSVSEIEIKN